MLEVQIVSKEIVLQLARRSELRTAEYERRNRIRQPRPVEIGLQTHFGPVGYSTRPATQEVCTAHGRVITGRQVFMNVVDITLQSEGVARGGLGVETKAALAPVPGILRRGAVGIDTVVAGEVFAIGAKLDLRGHSAAIAQASDALQFRSGAAFCIDALRICSGLGDDIDHAVDGVGTPQCASWSADDFNAIDVFKKIVLRFPEDARKKRCVDGPSVDHDQQLVGQIRIEATGADRPA